MGYPTSWNLSRYFYENIDDKNLQSDIENILPNVKIFAKKYKDTFHTFHTAKKILQFYQEYGDLSEKILTPNYYLFYCSSLDTQNLDVLKKIGELDHINTLVHNELLFIAQGWKSIGYDTIIKLSQDPLLHKYKNDLVSTANSIKYILSEKEEYVLNIKSRPLGLANALHDELTGSYEFEMNIDGTKKIMTEEEVRSHRNHFDRTIRKEAFDALRRIYNTKSNQITLGNIYTSIVKNWTTDIDIRGYGSNVMKQRNISEELDDEVVDMLLDQVQKAYPLYARFLQAKAHSLGLQGDFSIWDISAPIGKSEQNFSFEEAYDIHLGVMREFDEDFYQYSKAMVDEERIDVFPKKGKRGGAFASYRKGSPSFVLLNFTGKLRDISTISHEMGHAIHGWLSQKQEAPVYDSSLSMAETASIFAEILLGEKMQSITSKEEYKNYLNDRLGDIFATIFHQVQYILFERRVHTEIHTGKELTYKDLNVIWREEQSRLHGNQVIYDVDPDKESGWSMIPHIYHTPFYCYAYAFGNMLTFSLYNNVKNGQISIEDYKDILRAGGSERPRDLLNKYGIDITLASFYEAGISEIENMVRVFEEI